MGGRRFFLAFSFFFPFLLFLSPIALAQIFSPLQVKTPGEPIRMRADHISYDKTENTYVAEGKVEIWQGDRKLTADRVSLNAGTNEAEATGNVVLVQGGDVLQSKEMKIDLDTSRGIVLKGTLFLKQQNFYLRGEEIERVGEDTYRVKEGNFTTCDGDSPAWRFTGRETLVTLGEYASVHGATFEVKKIPLLYSPYLFFPVKTERQSGFLTPGVSYSNVAGPELKNAYFWAISKNTDATFYLDLAPQKGYGEGVEYRYIREKGSAGSFYGYHIREEDGYRQKYTDQLGRPPDRWGWDLRHEEYFSQTFFAKARLRDFSDRLYLKDYGLTYQDRALEQAYSILSLTKNWERYQPLRGGPAYVGPDAGHPKHSAILPHGQLYGAEAADFQLPLLFQPYFFLRQLLSRTGGHRTTAGFIPPVDPALEMGKLRGVHAGSRGSGDSISQPQRQRRNPQPGIMEFHRHPGLEFLRRF